MGLLFALGGAVLLVLLVNMKKPRQDVLLPSGPGSPVTATWAYPSYLTGKAVAPATARTWETAPAHVTDKSDWVLEDAQDLARQAGVDLQTFSLAKIVGSEWHSGNPKEKAAVAHLVLNEAKRRNALPRVVRKGSIGLPAQWLQEELKKRGYYKGVLDGQFLTKSEEALRAFQKDHGLAVDGKAADDEWSALGAAPPDVFWIWTPFLLAQSTRWGNFGLFGTQEHGRFAASTRNATDKDIYVASMVLDGQWPDPTGGATKWFDAPTQRAMHEKYPEKYRSVEQLIAKWEGEGHKRLPSPPGINPDKMVLFA